MQAVLFKLPTETSNCLILKGRNAQKVRRRNEFLVKRFYYWYELQRLRRDDVISILSESEVFLQPKTIEIILRQSYSLYKQIKADRPLDKQIDDYVFPIKD